MNIVNPSYAVVQRLIDALMQLKPEDVQRLEDTQYAAEIRIVKVKRAKTKAATANNMPNQSASAMEDIAQALSQLANRQEAYEVLQTGCKLKKDLQAVARILDVPFYAKDKIAELQEKIVEATAGAKIRSQTIQGN